MQQADLFAPAPTPAGLRLTSGNVYGAIFRERGWHQTGEWRASEFPGNRGHKSPLWEWKP